MVPEASVAANRLPSGLPMGTDRVDDVPFGILNDTVRGSTCRQASSNPVGPRARLRTGRTLTPVNLGIYDTVRPAWQAMNQAVADAAARHEIPLVRADDAFTGPDGERDPVAAGDVLEDETHLTSQGGERLVDLIAALGFEPLR